MKSAYELYEERRAKKISIASTILGLITISLFIGLWGTIFYWYMESSPRNKYRNLYTVSDYAGHRFYTEKVITVPGGIRFYDEQSKRFVEIYGDIYTIAEPKLNEK